jgi:hypothetical protein
MSGKKLIDVALEAKQSYRKTGDFKLTSEHIFSAEGGRTANFMEMMMGKEVISKEEYTRKEEDTRENERKFLLQYANLGNIKITI